MPRYRVEYELSFLFEGEEEVEAVSLGALEGWLDEHRGELDTGVLLESSLEIKRVGVVESADPTCC